jgi:hypothetical protein
MGKTEKELIQEGLKNSYSYAEYRELVERLAVEDKSTGPIQTEDLAHYTQLNNSRMHRWDKTLKIPADVAANVKSLKTPIVFIVLTESWCGDAAPSLPVFHKLEELTPYLKLRILLRDENLELMHRFLTNNTLSIPKVLLWDENSETVLADWGSRPKEAAKMVKYYREKHGILTAEFRESLQKWYNKDKGQSTLQEIVALLPLK